MSNVHDTTAWGGLPLDALPTERATDASWFAQRVYFRELEQGASEEVARDAALSRLRWRHDEEMHAAAAALDAVEGFPDVA